MKIGSVGSLDAVSNQMALAKINEDAKKKQIATTTKGYTAKHVKLIKKFNKLVNASEATDEDGNETYVSSGGSAREKEFDAWTDSIKNVIYYDDISKKERKEFESLLDELNKYQDENDGSAAIIHINRKNIKAFIQLFSELKESGIYFGMVQSVNGISGGSIDFKA